MKKLFFIMMAMMASISIYALEVNNENKRNITVSDDTSSYIIYTEYEVDAEDITLPFVIQVPVPPTGTVIGISGPVIPNITNWSVSGGYLTITYTRETEIFDLRNGGIFYIEVPTSPMPSIDPSKGYVIKLIVK